MQQVSQVPFVLFNPNCIIMKLNNEVVLIDESLYISTRELMSYKNSEDKSLSLQTIRNRASEYINEKSQNWVCVQKHLNGISQWWFLYLSIPKQSIKKWGLPSYEQFVKIAVPFENLETKNIEIEFGTEFRLMAAAIKDHPRFISEYQDLVIKPLKQLQYAKTHAVFVKMLELKRMHIQLPELFECYQKVATKESLSFKTKSFEYYCKKLRLAESKFNRVSFVIAHNAIGKLSNNLKLDDDSKRLIRNLYRRKNSYREITNKINIFRGDRNQDSVEQRTVELYLHNNQVKNLLLEDRFGRSKFMHEVIGYYDRYVDGVGAVWEIDGRKFPFVIIENGKPKFYSYVIVIDAYSKRVIGYCLSKSENRYSIQTALFNAAQNTKHLPTILIHDNHGPYKTKELQSLQLKMIEMGVKWVPSRPYNPRSKANVESSFNRFNKIPFRDKLGFVGESIVSSYNDSRPSREQMEKLLKNYTYVPEAANRLLIESIIEFNTTPISHLKGISPIEKFISNNSNKKVQKRQIKLTPQQIAFLFYPKAKSVVRKGEVRVQIDNEHYRYDLPTQKSVELYRVAVDLYYPPYNRFYGYLYYRSTGEFISKVAHKRPINEVQDDRAQKEESFIKRKASDKRSFITNMRSQNKKDDTKCDAAEIIPEVEFKRLKSDKDEMAQSELNVLLKMAGLVPEHKVEVIDSLGANPVKIELKKGTSKGKLKPLD